MTVHVRNLCGVVVSAGKMMKAVKVRCAKQTYNNFLKKHFLIYQSHLVSDPNSSLRQGDVVRIASGLKKGARIRHVVTEIVSPWGPPIEERPPIPSEEERMEVESQKRDARLERRMQRRMQRKKKGVTGEAEPEGKAREGGVEASPPSVPTPSFESQDGENHVAPSIPEEPVALPDSHDETPVPKKPGFTSRLSRLFSQ